MESAKCEAQNLVAGMNKINLEPIKSPIERATTRTSSSKLRDERAKSAFAAAFHNFQTAKKMAQDNLDHQPLPDAIILDKKFASLEDDSLDFAPVTGVGYKGKVYKLEKRLIDSS